MERGWDETEKAIVLVLRFPPGYSGRPSRSRAIRFRRSLPSSSQEPSRGSLCLGVSGGAAVGAIVAISIGLSALSFGLPLASFAGALLAVGVVLYFGRQNGKIHPNTLLLAGVITGSFLSAVIMFFISVSQKEELHTIIFWLMGDFSLSNDRTILMVFPYFLLGFFFIYLHSRQLNLILAGEENALPLGIDVGRLRMTSYLFASLMTAAAVSVCGLIGFVA